MSIKNNLDKISDIRRKNLKILHGETKLNFNKTNIINKINIINNDSKCFVKNYYDGWY